MRGQPPHGVNFIYIIWIRDLERGFEPKILQSMPKHVAKLNCASFTKRLFTKQEWVTMEYYAKWIYRLHKIFWTKLLDLTRNADGILTKY